MNTLLKPQTSFRPMRFEDLDEIMAIEPLIYPYPWTYGNFKDSLHAGHSGWVMVEQGEIVAYAMLMLVLDEAHLLNLSVAKPHQGKGLGRELLTQMIEVARRHHAANMFLEVRVSNTPAIGLYESIGFNEMAVRRGYYPAKNGREDAILMGLAI